MSGPPPNHHSTSLYPSGDSYHDQRTSSNFDLGSRHSERSSLESNYKKKRDKDKEKERERPRGENEFPHLPDVPGAEGTVLAGLCLFPFQAAGGAIRIMYASNPRLPLRN